MKRLEVKKKKKKLKEEKEGEGNAQTGGKLKSPGWKLKGSLLNTIFFKLSIKENEIENYLLALEKGSGQATVMAWTGQGSLGARG